MSELRVETPSRLHFGLFGWGPEAPRQFGGVGLMVDRPGLSISARPSDDWKGRGPLSDRVSKFARLVADALSRDGWRCPILEFQVHRAAPEHVGLGTGTQLGMAVTALMLEHAGFKAVGPRTMARFAERGLRSGIGLHGFARGGLIVDGGHPADPWSRVARRSGGIPPLLTQLEFPPEWAILLVIPALAGLHGPEEIKAFDRLPPVPAAMCDRICRLVLLALLPAVAERDLKSFGAALEELQTHVGRCFAPAQGGTYARPELETIAHAMKAEKLKGVGQSSWGPTLYGFSDQASDVCDKIAERLRSRLGLESGQVFWTNANQGGARLGCLNDDVHAGPD